MSKTLFEDDHLESRIIWGLLTWGLRMHVCLDNALHSRPILSIGPGSKKSLVETAVFSPWPRLANESDLASQNSEDLRRRL